MKNEQENLEQQEQATQVVTPPPFRPSDEPQEAQAPEPPASPTLDDRIAQLGLDESTSNRLSQLAGGLDAASLSPELLSTLARGITHDQDVENADAAGYLRGRNEKIEAVLPPQPQDDEASRAPIFPRYCRRSIWD